MDGLLNTRLFQPGDRVLVALSGGTDSLSLLHILVSAKAELGLTVAAVHVHHGMRGPQADADVRSLEETCRSWGVDLHVESADVPALARRRGVSVEEAGRNARYEAFVRVGTEVGAGQVATAHTADDQVETVLFRLLRGTGTDGLAGIPQRRPLGAALEVVRPLLGIWRTELEAYVREHDLQPLDDCTNRDLHYQRSRIRHELLPVLEGYGPEVKPALLRLARQAREEGELLDRLAAELLVEVRQAGFPWQAHATVSIAPLAEAAPALARRALRLAVREAYGWSAEVDSRMLDRLLQLVGGAARAVEIPGAAGRVRRHGDLLTFEGPAPTDHMEAPLTVRLPGPTSGPAWGIDILVREVSVPEEVVLPPLEALFDADALHRPLRLRAPRSGDRFHPLNAPGTRLLSDLFMDRKIPAADRSRWLVFEDAEGIAWVPGVALAHRVRVRAETQRCWSLRLTAHAILGPSEEQP